MKRAATVAVVVGVVVLSSATALARPRAFTIMGSAEGTKAKFPYLFSLPDPVATTGWVAGDRVAYRCAYMFLRTDGQIVGRVTFTRIEYARINDKYMDEAERFYDGAVYHGSHHQLNDCPAPSEPYVEAEGPIGPLPVVTFSDRPTGRILEVRDYAHVVEKGSGPPWRFQIVSATPKRVSVIAYQSREPVMAIYYDRLSRDISLTSNARANHTRVPALMTGALGWRLAARP